LMLRKYDLVFSFPVRDRLGDQRLATARWPVEQDALGRLEVVLVEQLGVEVGQLDRVVDLFDLVVESADVGVGDVGDFFEDEFFDLWARDALHQQAGAGIDEHMLAGAQLDADEVLGEFRDAFFVGPADDEGAAAVFEEFLEDHDLALGVDSPGEHDVQRLVEHYFLAPLQAGDIDLGVDRDSHLAAGGKDIDGAIVVGAEQRAVARGRHRELLHFFSQRRDVLAGLAECGGEAFVLGDGLGELALGLEDPLFEGPHPLGRVLQPAAQGDDLLVQRLQLVLKFANLLLVLGEAPYVFAGHDEFLPTDRVWRVSRTLSSCSSLDGVFPHARGVKCRSGSCNVRSHRLEASPG